MILTIENYKQIISSYVEEKGIKEIDLNDYFTKVDSGLANEMTSCELVRYCGEVAASMITVFNAYNDLAAIILIKDHHSKTFESFSQKIQFVQESKNTLNDEIYACIMQNAKVYDSIVDYSRDYHFDYFGFISLLKSYLIRVGENIVERPQDMYMRVAIELHKDNFEKVAETYNLLSNQMYTHATPTLYNSCFKKNQLASCFLLAMKDDTIPGIFETIKESAIYSKLSGGIGIHLSNLRCNNSPLVTTGGVSKGIVPIIKMMNETMKYINQGGARRCSTGAFYLEVWHKDIFSFLDLRKNTGSEELRAREIFTALFVNDLFMERVEKNENWTLFDPNVAKNLNEVWGEKFNQLYVHYENTISDKTVIPAQKLWKEIICAQIETGTPYMLYKDACNRNTNHSNFGTVKSSNLCAEIIQYSDAETTAVCSLASICLPKFVEITEGKKQVNYSNLCEVTKVACRNLNAMLDTGIMPTPESEKARREARALGIGVQGLADMFFKLGISFDSDEARVINRNVFETMYYAAMEASCEESAQYGPYPCYEGSMYSKGIFHFEKYWDGKGEKQLLSGMWDWEGLRSKILKFGLRNSLTLACMPTASTAQLCGNSECIEPVQNNIFTRRTFAGEFQIVNKYLMEDLKKLGLWSHEMRQLIIEYNGSIQDIPVIPPHIKQIYKTVWEMKMKRVIDMADDRQAFIDQSQSLNLFIKQPTYSILSSMHFYGWKKGLKTGMYYLRTNPIAKPIKFTVDKELIAKTLSSMNNGKKENEEEENNGVCESCTC